MIKFDRMKLIAPIESISNINTDIFHTQIHGERVIYYKYKQKEPYLLEIRADYEHRELVIEFSGKILYDKYIDLINEGNITECLKNINRLGICTLDCDGIIESAIVAKCDVTKDIPNHNISEIISTIRQNIKNYKKWNVSEYPASEGVVLNNVVKTPKYKKRLIVYDKSKELNKCNNNSFLDALLDKNSLLLYFKNKVRFEFNINTMEQVRNYLNIPNNKLTNVLSSTANPILSVIDEAIKFDIRPIQRISLRDYERKLLIEKCNNDIVEVEALIRNIKGNSQSISRVMKPYRELLCKASFTSAIDLRELVA